jgi:Ran GTPase-activating protein (RanGAP) involved in mRNA processing and transport
MMDNLILEEIIKKILSNDTQYRVLDLSHATLSDEQMNALCSAIDQNTEIISLNLKKHMLSNKQLKQLLNVLETNYTIARIDLTETMINANIIEYLCDKLSMNTTVISLLFDAQVKQSFAAALAPIDELLIRNRQLEKNQPIDLTNDKMYSVFSGSR